MLSSFITFLTALLIISPLPVATRPFNVITSPKHAIQPRTSTLNGEVQWTHMTSNDGRYQGTDADEIDYFMAALEHFVEEVPVDERIGVFRTGGEQNEQLEDEMNEFIEEYLDGRGAQFDTVFDADYISAQVLPGCPETENLEWRLIYRASKALAAGSNGGIAYIHMSRVNGRTIFSPPSKEPQDYDPEHKNAATVGETWHYAELPMLMRNSNIQQIFSFWKDRGSFNTHLEWDADRDHDAHPRDQFTDIAMDATPIMLPAAAERDPMK